MDFDQADAVNQAVRLPSLRAAALLAPLGLHPGQEALLLELAWTGPGRLDWEHGLGRHGRAVTPCASE